MQTMMVPTTYRNPVGMADLVSPCCKKGQGVVYRWTQMGFASGRGGVREWTHRLVRIGCS
jgi:hypothetical protein